MSDFGDYLGEMDKNGVSDEQIEALFGGSPNVGDEPDPVAGLFAALRTDFSTELGEEAVARVAAIASAATPTPVPGPTQSVSRRKKLLTLGSLRRRAATVAMTATVFLGGTSGLAFAADGAMPGDMLYGVDRAFEAVGIGAGGEQERLLEAEALVDSGQVVRGLEHAADAFDESEPSSSNASVALMAAAERLRTAGAEQSAETREGVAGLLTYLAENTGKVDGRQVAELAVQIGRRNGQTPPGQAGAGDSPASNPEAPPGLSEDKPGPPDDPPGQDKDKKETGPPTIPPGQDKDKNEPGPPDSLPNSN